MLANIIPRIFALNDAHQTWTYDLSTSSAYTYDSSLITVNNTGAHPKNPNFFNNPSFTSDTSSWDTSVIPPSGWVEVPGNDEYSTSNFLVMQYEAKAYDTQDDSIVADGGYSLANSWAGGNTQTQYRAVSTTEGRPWVRIAQNGPTYDALEACIDAGSLVGFNTHLITNNEWMTIARNAEVQNVNWTGGSVGNGSLFRGNSDGIPASMDGTDNLSGINTRGLTLSNGSVVWDMAGNVYDWVDATNMRKDQPVAWDGVTDASGSGWSELASGSSSRYIKNYKTGSPLQQKDVGPSNLSYNSNQGVGRLYHYSDASDSNTTEYGFLRGSGWNNSRNAGVFSLHLMGAPMTTFEGFGFRCASDPVVIPQSYSSTSGRQGGGNTITIGQDTDGKISQSINVGDTQNYDFSVYVSDATIGNEGGTVSQSVAQLYYDGQSIDTTYTSVGDGWWKLSGTVTGANQIREYGLLIKSSKTVIVDDFTLSKVGIYSITTTTAYENNQVNSWDTFCEGTLQGSTCTKDAVYQGLASIYYQICVDDGSSCSYSSGSRWQYFSQGEWHNASDERITHSNTASDLTKEAMQLLPIDTQKISVRAIFIFGGLDSPKLSHLSIGLTTDTIAPSTNATDVKMYRDNGGTQVQTNDWTNNSSVYFSWMPGEDNLGGSGLRGYCVYLGTDPLGDPATSKGILGTSPQTTVGTTCQFLTTATSLDFATLSLRGDPWLSTSNSAYYINIKAVDNSGNVTASSASFHFRFDNTAPTNTSYISCASGSFSNVADMSFNWPTTGGSASTDSNAGVLGWQYQLNSTEGDWLGTGLDTQTDLDIEYIPTSDSSRTFTAQQDGLAIISGANVVYFRTVDNAGNVSTELRTCNISYGGAAPDFEDTDSVTITPNSATENAFSLSWPEATATNGQSVAHYYYMVNTTPPSTLATLQGNAGAYIDNGTVRTVDTVSLPNVNKGSNTVYVVAVDTAQTPNYSPSNYISGTFTLNSNDPDNVRNLTASDSSIKAENRWMVTLSWTEPEYKGAGNLNYTVYRSSDGSIFSQVGSTAGLSYVDTTPASSKYYYKIVTKDGANATSSGTNTVAITPTGRYTQAPVSTSGPDVSSITTSKATISWSTTRKSDSKISFGTKSGEYQETEPSNSQPVTSHKVQLTGLKPGTTYYYKAKWTDEDGNTGESNEEHFTTAPAPTVKDVVASAIGLTSSTLSFTSDGASQVRVYYGTTTAFGGSKTLSTSTSETEYTVSLSELVDGTKYYYKINTFDSDGTEYEGTVLDFTTLPRPKISTVRLQQIANSAQSSVLVSWKTNTKVSSIVTYYPEEDSNNAKDQVNIELVEGDHQMVLRGLLPKTNYILVVKGRDTIGNEAVSDLQRFTTATDTRAPQISGLRVEGSNIPPVTSSGQESVAQLVVSWTTDEPATSQVEFGEGTGSTYSQKTQIDSNLKTNHLVVITGLTPSKAYHLRAISQDKALNTAHSVDTVTLTPKATENALNLVIQNLQHIFGFLGGILP